MCRKPRGLGVGKCTPGTPCELVRPASSACEQHVPGEQGKENGRSSTVPIRTTQKSEWTLETRRGYSSFPLPWCTVPLPKGTVCVTIFWRISTALVLKRLPCRVQTCEATLAQKNKARCTISTGSCFYTVLPIQYSSCRCTSIIWR